MDPVQNDHKKAFSIPTQVFIAQKIRGHVLRNVEEKKPILVSQPI